MTETASHVRELVELLRGKAVIERADFLKGSVTVQSDAFDFSFLDYVSWPYAERINRILSSNNGFSGIDLVARQLFSPVDRTFVVRITPMRVYFLNTVNAEDTLLLDLQRYLDARRIPYEVS